MTTADNDPAAERSDAPRRAVALLRSGDARAAEAMAGGDPAPLLALARSWREGGQAPEAEAAVALALAIRPDDAGALVLRGEIARDGGDRALALACFAAAAAADPDSFWAQLHLAEALRQDGRLPEAEAAAAAALRLRPGDAHALMALGHCARGAGDAAAALGHFRAARDADPDNRWTWLTLAEAERAAGAIETAEATLHALLARRPGDALALVALGECARARGDLPGALARFEAATRADATNGWAWLHLGQARCDLGATAAAEAAARRAAALLPGHGGALLLLGTCARRRGVRRSALRHVNAAARLEPDNPWIRIALAELHAEGGAFAAARRALKPVLARAPGHLPALLALARTEAAAGATEAADAILARAAAANPAEAAPLVERAKLAWRRGAAEAARALAEAARRLAPRDPAPIELLADLARESAEAAAETLYAEAAALDPGRPWPHVGLARSRLDQGDAIGALAALGAAEASQGPAAAFAALRIELLRRIGDWPGALATAREAAARWADPWVREQQVLIELRHAGPAAAAAALARLARDHPGEAARHAHLAGLVEEAGWRIAAARAHYHRALESDPWRQSLLTDATRAALLCCDLAEARRHLQTLTGLGASRRFRASHTLLGTLLNEYALDQALLTEIVAARALPQPARVAALLDLVRAHPDATGPAIQLLVALREAGPLGLRVPSGEAIPARFCQVWAGPAVPHGVRALMDSWAPHLPEGAIARFDATGALDALRARFPAPVVAAFRAARTARMRAELFRLAWLVAEGGFSAAADARCLGVRLFDASGSLVPAGTDLLLVLGETGAPGTDLIGAVPGHPVLRDALARAVAAINRGDNDGAWLMTGPGLLARALAGAMASAGDVVLAGCHILDAAAVGGVVATRCHVVEAARAPGALRA